MSIKSIGYTFLVVSLLTGALTPIVLKLATGFGIVEFFMLTYLIGIPLSYLLVVGTRKRQELRTYLKAPKKVALIGLMGVLTYLPFEVAILYAEHFVSAALATVVFRINPLLMLVFIPTLLRERLSRNQIIALMLAFIGVYFALTGGQLTSIFNNPDLGIVSLLVLSALSYALSTLFMKKYIFDMASGIVIFNIVLFALFAIAFVATGMITSPLSLVAVGAMLYVALMNNVIGFYAYFSAFRLLKTTFVTNFYFLSPFITLFFANLLLGEAIEPYYVLIAVLVTTGLIIQKFDKVGGTYLAAKPERTRNFVIFDVSGAFANTGEAAISAVLNDGGRVLAVNLPSRHRETIGKRLAEGDYSNVFTGEHKGISNEIAFVRDMIGSKPEDTVLLKAGSFDEGEAFFGDMSDLIEPERLSGRGTTSV